MNQLLDNPVFHALQSGDAHLGSGTDTVKFFDEKVSPFAGFPEDHHDGFNELHALLSEGRKILFATRNRINEPQGWQLNHEVSGLQFVFYGKSISTERSHILIPLEKKHVEEMIALARPTKPGPFDQRTIEFGNYYGIFENDRLVAMTGQRLHVSSFTEISAVCTHPDFLGKGFAAALIQHQLELICKNSQTPFLHVRADNKRAIEIYERLGFKENGPMNFYFMKRK